MPDAFLAHLQKSTANNSAGLWKALTDAKKELQARLLAEAQAKGLHTPKGLGKLAKTVGGFYGEMALALDGWGAGISGKEWAALAWDMAGVEYDPSKLVQFDKAFTRRFWTYNVKPFIAAKADGMAAADIKAIRDAAQDVNRQGDLLGWTSAKRYRAMRDRVTGLAADPEQWRFIDTKAKRWTGRNYFAMLNRTVSANVARAAHDEALVSEGFDVVRIRNAGGPCPLCEPWGGKLVSLTGATKGLPTMAEARATGLFHPNCVCHDEFVSAALAAEELKAGGITVQPPPEKAPPEPKPVTQTGPAFTPGAPAAEQGSAGGLASVAVRRQAAKKAGKGLTQPGGVAPPAGSSVEAVFPVEEELAGLKVVRSLGGSTGAELVEDARGARWVRKRGASADHILEETLADAAYQRAGVPVPRFKLYTTDAGPVKLAEYIEGQTLGQWSRSATVLQKAEARAQLQAHFHIDALLANRDVVGLDVDNVLVDKAGKLWRIDNGGSLRYRAQGGVKDGWDEFPLDFWSMRDRAAHPEVAEWFHDLDVFKSAAGIERMDVDAIAGALGNELGAVVRARAEHLKDWAATALDMGADEFLPTFADNVGLHMMKLRKAGLHDALPKELKVFGKDQLADAQNVAYGGLLKTDAGLTVAEQAGALPNDFIYEKLLTAAKHINHHVDLGDIKTALNMAKVDPVLGQKDLAKALTGAITPQEVAEGWHYLPLIESIEKAVKAAKTAKPIKVPTVTPFVPQGKAAAKAQAPKKTAWEIYKEHVGGSVPASKSDDAIYAHTRWSASHKGSSDEGDAKAFAWWFKGKRGVGTDRYAGWRQGDRSYENAYQAWVGRAGAETVDTALTAHYAFTQEVLKRVSIPHNDRVRRAVLLSRTEEGEILKHAGIKKYGTDLKMKRGANQSCSIYTEVRVLGSQRTQMAVPHHRVTAAYFTPDGHGKYMFCGAGENELTAMLEGLPFRYVKQMTFPMTTDAATWGMKLDHLRKP